MEFNDVYDANDQVDPSEDNPLSLKVDALRTSEDAILRNPDYRDSLDSTALEFGPDALLWDSVAKNGFQIHLLNWRLQLACKIHFQIRLNFHFTM